MRGMLILLMEWSSANGNERQIEKVENLRLYGGLVLQIFIFQIVFFCMRLSKKNFQTIYLMFAQIRRRFNIMQYLRNVGRHFWLFEKSRAE